MSNAKTSQKELIAQLKEQSATKSKTEIASQSIKKRATLDSVLTAQAYADCKLKTKDRAYRMTQETEDKFVSHDVTSYYDTTLKMRVAFTQAISDKLCEKFLQTHKNTEFTFKALRDAFQTLGGAYGDKIRKSVVSRLAMLVTKKQFETEYATYAKIAQDKKMLALVYNDNEDKNSRRVQYIIKTF
jgi:hypothetical protein